MSCQELAALIVVIILFLVLFLILSLRLSKHGRKYENGDYCDVDPLFHRGFYWEPHFIGRIGRIKEYVFHYENYPRYRLLKHGRDDAEIDKLIYSLHDRKLREEGWIA